MQMAKILAQNTDRVVDHLLSTQAQPTGEHGHSIASSFTLDLNLGLQSKHKGVQDSEGGAQRYIQSVPSLSKDFLIDEVLLKDPRIQQELTEIKEIEQKIENYVDLVGITKEQFDQEAFAAKMKDSDASWLGKGGKMTEAKDVGADEGLVSILRQMQMDSEQQMASIPEGHQLRR